MSAKIVSKVKEVVKKVAAKMPVKKAAVSDDVFFVRVQEKAHELFVNRGCVHGDQLNDWYEAEKLVRAEIKKGK